MKRKITIILLIAITGIIGAIVLKVTVPLSCAEKSVDQESVDFVAEIQNISTLTAEQAAMKYYVYHTDYQRMGKPETSQKRILTSWRSWRNRWTAG